MAHLIRPIVFVPLMVATFAWGLTHPPASELLARCEATGAHPEECRLQVLGR